MTRARMSIPLIALLALGVAAPAHAYTVGTAFTEPCHERLTAAAIEDFVERLPFEVPLVESDRTQRVARHFVRLYGADDLSPQAQSVLFSLIMGVRDPDSEGVSPTDLSGSRYLHANTEGQDEHALRRPGDDGPEGDLAAIRALRESIEDSLTQAQLWFARPVQQQLREVDYYLESYGAVRVHVWAPGFYLGRALHTLQDSFSHALRTPDMRRLTHIFNYIEAIGDMHDLDRDGIRHSSEMDACYVGGDSSSLFLAAREASTQLVEEVFRAQDGELGDASDVLDQWLGYEAGCSFDNNYCDNPFVSTASVKATAPIGTCDLGRSKSHGGWLWILLLGALCVRRRALLLPMILSALVIVGCKPTPLLQEEFEVGEPCGGDASGIWYFAATSELVPRESNVAECPLIRDELRVLYSGRVDLGEDGSVTPGVTLRRHEIQVRDASCDDACESDPSCVARGEVCHCLQVTRGEWRRGQAGSPSTWATQGDTLELLDVNGDIVLSTGYCVEGEEMEWASTTSPSIGQRLQRAPSAE